MKKINQFLTAVALLLGVATVAQAQTVEDNYPYNFITVQGGAQGTFTNYKFDKLLTPQVALSAGRYFNSKVGARLHFQGWQIKGALSEQTYKFNALTGDLDLLVNLTNVINPSRVCDKFDWVFILGAGVNYGWDFDEFNTLNRATYFVQNPEHPELCGTKYSTFNTLNRATCFVQNPELCGTKHSTFNGRFGTQFNLNLSSNLALGLEVDANYKNDEFNLKRNYNPDWQLAALVGLTYKFGKKKTAPAPVPAPAPVVEEPAPAPAPVPVVKDEPLREVFYYNIRLSDPDPESRLTKIADWCKKYPQKKISVRGYADKGTGNPRINVGYAKARAEKVAKALQEKGVAADRMTVESFGDTVQPFTANDDNRCVIVVGE